MRVAGRCVVLLIFVFTGCLPPINAYDPDNDPSQQAKASVLGTVVIDRVGADPDVVLEDLRTLRLELKQGGELVKAGRCEPLGALEFPLDCDESSGTAGFVFDELTPGNLRLTIPERPADLLGMENALSIDLLAPGEERDLGDLVLREPTTEDNAGQAVIAGRVNLQDVQGGPRTVTLYKRTGTGAQPIRELPTDGEGGFSFAGLDNGTYGLLAERPGFAPDFRVGITVTGARTPEPPTVLFDEGSADGDALLLYPVTAVLKPNLSTEDNGAYYTRDDEVAVDVLAFTDASQLSMRVSTDPAFAAEAAPFAAFTAQVTVALPNVQGPVPIYAQFQAQSPDHPEFVFTTDLFSTEVVRDTVPPAVIDVEVRNLVPDADGTYWQTEDGAAVGLDVLAVDETSQVARAQVHIQADNGPGDETVLAGADIDAPPGLAQLQLNSVASAGEGEKVFWVWLADQAGNAADPVPVSIMVDTSPPVLGDAGQGILPLEVQNADAGGVLKGRSAQVAFFVPDDLDLADEPVAMRVHQDAIPAGTAFGPFVASQVLSVTGANGSSFSFTAEVKDRAGNVLSVDSPVYTLDLTGTVGGRALVDQEPGDSPVHSGIVARLYAPGAAPGTDAPVDETLTDALGGFVFGQVPEGTGYFLTLERAGLVATEIPVGQVVAGQPTAVGTTRLAYARGNVTGVFRFEDKADDLSAHGGILVSAVLNGDIIDQTVTEPDGSYTFPVPGLVVTVGSDRYELRASYESYFTATETGIQVVQNQTTIVAEDTPGEPTPVLLKPISGDFILCHVGDDPCTQKAYTNATSAQIRLQADADVTDIRVQARTPFDAGDATPAWQTYVPGAPPTVDISGADGVVEVYVQVVQGGVNGPVLSASILLDTVAPEPSSVTAESTQPNAVGAFTNLPVARVRVSASAGQGDVAPLGSAYVTWAATAPGSIPPGADVCAANAACVVDLPGGAAPLEQVHTVWGFACDQAGNCSQNPLSAGIVYDVTEPRALHGVQASPTGAAVIESAGTFYTTIAQYLIDLGVGTAQTDALTPVLDVTGAPVADVAAYRFLPVYVGTGIAPPGVDMSQVAFTDASGAGAGATLANLVGPGLSGNDGAYRVFAQFRDRAGNVSAADNNPFYFDLVLDTAPPSVSFTVDGGSPYTTSTTVSLDITAPPTDSPTRVWVSKDGGLFTDYDEATLGTPPGSVPFDLSDSSDYVGDGLYFVYARFFDAAGNDVDRTDSITLDTTPPDTVPLTCSSCVLDAGNVLTADRTVVLELFASDALSGVKTIRTSVDGGAPAEQDFVLSHAVLLPDSDGAHTVSVVFVDGAGNPSAPRSLAITLDRVAPTIGTFALNDGAAYTTDATVDVTIVAAGATALRLSNSATFLSAFGGFSPSTVWTLGSPAVDGSKEVFVEVRDPAGNVAQSSATIILDTSPPAGTVSIAAGAAATSDSTPDVALTFPNDTAAYALQGGAADCATVNINTALTVGTTSLTVTQPLPAPDGTKTVTACFVDQAGNIGLAADDILLDTTAPSGTVLVNGGAAFSTSPTVDVLLSASEDVTEVLLTATAPNCTTATGYQSYEPNKQFTFAATDGAVTLYACLRDRVGLTYAMSDGITLDGTAPSAAVSINGGDSHTTTRNVTLAISADADVTDLSVANGPSLDCATATYSPFTASQNWTLPTPDGTKQLAVCVRDAAGQVGSASTSIVLDTTPPSGTLNLAGGSTTTQSTTVSASVSFPSDTNGYALANDGLDCATATYTPVTVGLTGATTSIALSSGDGLKAVAACFRDVAGNTAAAFDSISLDTTDPVGAVSVNSGAVATSSTSVTVSLSASPDVTQVALAQGPLNCATATYEAMASSKLFTLGGGDGTKVVTACFRDGSGRTGTANDPIVLDTLAPPIGAFTIDQGETHTAKLPVTLDLTATDATSGIQGIRLANDNCANLTGPLTPYASSLPWTLSTGADSVRTVCVEVTDYAGNTSTQTDTITVDRASPGGSLSINGGAAFTTTTTVSLSGTADEAVQIAVGAESIDCSSATYSGLFSTSISGTATLFSLDGNRTVYACLKDRAGNVSVISDTIVLDTAVPSAIITVDGGAPYSTDTTVDVDFSGAPVDTTDMFVTGTTLPNCALLTEPQWVAYLPSTTTTLTNSDGPREVHACLRDAAGNISPVGPAYITLDQVPPTAPTAFSAIVNTPGATTASGDTTITNGELTNDPRPRINWGGGSDATSGIQGYSLQLSTSSSFAFVDYESDLWPAGGILPPAELTDGTWYFRVRAVDRAGHESLSASRSLVVDTVAPDAPSLLPIVSPQNSNIVTDWVDGGGGNGTFEIKLENAVGVTVWQDMTATSTYTLLAGSHMSSPSAAAGDGYTFSVRAFDDLGQASPWTIDTFVFDNVAPCESGVSVLINGGQAFTNANDVIADISCTGDTPVQMQVDCNGTSPQTKPVVPYQPTFSCSLDILSQGLKRVDAQVRDAAGNVRAMNSDAITFDNVPPSPPLVAPANSVGVNYECARIDVPAGSTLDTNFNRYEQRSNGGPWINTVPSGGKIQFDLEQDTDNLLEIRAVDSAGNVGEASVAFVNETSSSVIPTNLTVKQVCDGGRFAILKDTSIWPVAFGLPNTVTSNPAEVNPVVYPDIYVLDLTNLGFYRLSGEGGLAKIVAQSVNFLDPPRFDLTLDAACTIDDDRIVMSYVEPFASPSFDDGGEVRTVVWRDPLNNPYTGLSGTQGPWSFYAGGTMGYAMGSMDVLRWTSTTDPHWEALVTSNYIAGFLPAETLNRVLFNGTPIVRDNGNSNPSFIEGQLNGFETRQYYGLAFSGASSLYLRRGTNQWEVARTTSYYAVGGVHEGLTYPDAAGFSATVSPYGTMVKRDVFESYNTVYAPYQMMSAATAAGEVRAYAAFTTSSVQVAPAAYPYPTYYQRGYRTAAWLHDTLDNVFELTDSYNANPAALSAAERQDRQYPADDRRPMLSTGDTTPGNAAVLYHTSDGASIQGVVVGFADEGGCFND